MKRILTTMCALTLILAAAVPALAVEPEQSASYYPTSVEEYMEGDSPRIKKVYSCPWQMIHPRFPPRILSGMAASIICWT